MVRRYAGSNDPAIMRQAEWVILIMIADSGRRYRSDRCWDRFVTTVNSSLIYSSVSMIYAPPRQSQPTITLVRNSATTGESFWILSFADCP